MLISLFFPSHLSLFSLFLSFCLSLFLSSFFFSFSQPVRFVLRANDFPYNVVPGIQHWLLWCNRPEFPGNSMIVEIERRLGRQDDPHNDLEYELFENPPYLRSIPDLCHAHIFLRRRHPKDFVMEVCIDSVASARAAKAAGQSGISGRKSSLYHG